MVLSGRRETIIEDESWIGPEIFDPELLDFPVEDIFVLLTNKELHKKTVRHLRSLPCMHGIIIKQIKRSGVEIPVYPKTVLYKGDTLEIVGLKREISETAPTLGYVDRPTNKTDMIFVGLGPHRRYHWSSNHSFRWCSYQFEYKWRSSTLWIILRLVTNQTPDLRTSSRTSSLDIQ